MSKFTKATKNNCKENELHKFVKIQNTWELQKIREQLNKLINPLWKCEHCGKIIEST